MKLTQSLALLVSAAFTIPFALANFHLHSVQRTDTGMEAGRIACPSKEDDCNCLQNGVGRGVIGGDSISPFIEAGFCGSPQLDFYQRANGHWDIYNHGGDGSVQGECYFAGSDMTCDGSKTIQYHDFLICYTTICQPDN